MRQSLYFLVLRDNEMTDDKTIQRQRHDNRKTRQSQDNAITRKDQAKHMTRQNKRTTRQHNTIGRKKLAFDWKKEIGFCV